MHKNGRKKKQIYFQINCCLRSRRHIHWKPYFGYNFLKHLSLAWHRKNGNFLLFNAFFEANWSGTPIFVGFGLPKGFGTGSHIGPKNGQKMIKTRKFRIQNLIEILSLRSESLHPTLNWSLQAFAKEKSIFWAKFEKFFMKNSREANFGEISMVIKQILQKIIKTEKKKNTFFFFK